MSKPLVADTGGLLRALARGPNGQPAFPEYESALTSAALVIVPALVLAEADYFLRDERAERILEADATFYLRVLLTDQRGWNVRNDVAHGITPMEQFVAAPADRLFRALLLLGSLRPKPPEASEGGVSGEECHEKPATPQGPSSG